MQCPVWCSAHPSPLLAKLKAAGGFSSWFTFNKLQDFYQALGVGLIWHTYLEYTEIKTYIQETWNLQLQSLIAIDKEFTTTQGADRHKDPAYWTQIETTTRLLCSHVFESLHPPKPHLSEPIAAGRVLDFVDVTSYRIIAKYFKICLCVYQLTDDQLRATEFASDGEGEFALFICMAFEAGKLSVLLHKDFIFKVVDEPAFPYYIKLTSKGSHLPQIEGVQKPIENARNCEGEYAVIIRTLVRMIRHLSRAVVASTESLDPSLRDDQDFLRQTQLEVQRLLLTHPELQSTLNIEELDRVVSMEVREQSRVDSRLPHTITTCSLYPDGSEFLLCHGHQFHKVCMQEYLQACSNRGNLDLSCPCCDTPLPGKVLEGYPELRKRFFTMKNNVVAAATSSKSVERCSACLSEVSPQISVLFAHGCRLCASCLSKCWSTYECIWCGKRFTNEEVMSAQAFLSRRTVPPASASRR